MIISPFSSLFFLGIIKHDGVDSPSMQYFSTADTITIEVIRTSEEPSALCALFDAGTLNKAYDITSETIAIGSNIVDIYKMSNLAVGYYYAVVGDNISEPFFITDSKRLIDKSVLIEYSPVNNSVRNDVVSLAGSKRVVFAIRMPGGFKDSGWNFSVDNEQFITSMADIVELYGMESTQQSLTVGFSQGVPIWFGQMLNRILTCKYVYIDGKRYARFESSVPEKEQTLDGVNSFVFTQKLQRINYLEPDVNAIK